ncbi:TonB-dependent receptor domain-containing protein [Pseudoduganella sp. GCM10020061]|uniref:TonB-dependent receptor domain-containing protein n=1 Tax=Pseudoduganella sp. GCM10020061 TaxID=3317345 RepID=UPI00363B1B6A
MGSPPLLHKGCAAALLCALQAAASAQAPPVQPPVAAPAAKPAPAGAAAPAPPPSEVTVVGARPTNRADRQVYDIGNDPGASNDTAADALNKVPSVSVDPDGNVTLRGKQNVQVLIDGKPSAMLQGEQRGAALNALPAGDIASVEVINNPGAQFGNESGGGPVINIVMKRTRRAGGFAVLNANAGTAGRRNASLNGSYHAGRFGAQGSVHMRQDGRGSSGHAARTRIHPVTGVESRSTQDTSSRGLNDSAGFSGSLTYNLDERDKLAANASFSRRGNGLDAHDRYVHFGQDDIADSDYERSTMRTGESDHYSVGASWERKGALRGERFSADLRLSSSDTLGDNAFTNTYTLRPPGVLDTRSRQAGTTANRIADLTADYERPGESGTLKLGGKWAGHTDTFDTRYTSIDPATGIETVNPVRTNRFRVGQASVAVYGSYEWRPGERWGVLGGLRVEHIRLDIDQMTSGIRADNRDTSLIPSFYINYSLSEATDVRLSYARRLRRPDARELNPFVVYRDEFNVSSGNPHLRPGTSDSLDLGLETRIGTVETNLRAFYEHDAHEISERRYFISETVLLTTRDNSGSSRSAGLEFSANGKLLPNLTLHTSGTVNRMEQRSWDEQLGGDARRSATSLTGRARFNYKATKQDTVQLTLSAQGASLFGQGSRKPYSHASVNYRRTLTPALSLVLNVNDVFGSTGSDTRIETPVLRERNVRRFDGRVVYLGLSYRLGGVTPAPGANRPRD